MRRRHCHRHRHHRRRAFRYYYKTRSDGQPTGVVALNGAKIVDVPDEGGEEPQFILELSSQARACTCTCVNINRANI